MGPGPQLAAYEHLDEAARQLVAFNTEFSEPTPDAAWLADRLRSLVGGGDTSVVFATDRAGVAVMRFRHGIWDEHLECYLAELYIKPALRGRGLGAELLTACLAHARELGASYMDLTTTEDDVAARHLYERHGFSRTEGRPDGALAFYYELDL